MDGLNSSAQENGPAFLDDEATGQTLLYFSRGRPGGKGGLDIYVAASVGDAKNVFGPPTAVSELNSGSTDYQPALRKDGLEIFFASNRSGGSGNADLNARERLRSVVPARQSRASDQLERRGLLSDAVVGRHGADLRVSARRRGSRRK